MLDKSIPYHDIIMGFQAGTPLPQPVLPTGYSFRFFREGDERHWARLETKVLEFPNEQEALEYFTRDYLPNLPELKRRLVFVVDTQDLPVATANAWFADTQVGYQASLHWVCVDPDCQGLGLGKAVVLRALQVFEETDPGEDIYLHTQTWSHVAVRMYRKLGFYVVKSQPLGINTNGPQGAHLCKNEYAEAMEVLKPVLEAPVWRDLVDSTR